jgi:hypothetical protein
MAEVAWQLCRLIYRFYAVILSVIFSFVFFKSTPVIVVTMALGIAVDAWRFRQFLKFPSDLEVRIYGLVLAAAMAVAIALPMTLRPDLFGYLIAHTYHDYQMTIRITSDIFRAEVILFTESFILVSAYIFSLAQLIAFELGNYRYAEKTKIKKAENKPLVLLFLLLVFLLILIFLSAVAIQEPSIRGPGRYLPHFNLLFLTHFALGFYAFAYFVRFFMSAYRLLESEWRSKGTTALLKPP